MNDDSVARALEARLAFILGFTFELGLFEDAANEVADLSGLLKTAVGQRRVVWCRRCEVPFLIGGV